MCVGERKRERVRGWGVDLNSIKNELGEEEIKNREE